MTPTPLVSVLIPVYNGEKYLREALENVLNQTYKNIEVICVDDGSQDGSRAILESFGTRITLIVHDANRGIAQARNTALARARGEFVAFMDADDLWDSKKLELQVQAFADTPGLDISVTMLRCFISPDLAPEVAALRYCPPGPMPGYLAGTAMVRAGLFAKVGAFDPRFRVGEFIDWMARAKAAGLTTQMLPQETLRRRIHASNTGVTERDSRVDYIKVVREALARKKNPHAA